MCNSFVAVSIPEGASGFYRQTCWSWIGIPQPWDRAVRIAAQYRSGEVGVSQRGGATLLAEQVERAVAADGEEPGGEMAVEAFGVFAAEAQEGVLHDVAGPFEVARQADGVPQQRAFVFG